MSFFERGERFDLELYEATGMLPYDEAQKVEEEILAERAAKAREILEDPARDWYEEYPILQPKYDIGQYVASHGIAVPTINSLEEWKAAMDEGVLMLRSEQPQDYSGYSGLLSSHVVSRRGINRRLEIIGGIMDNTKPDFRHQLTDLLLEGLRSGMMDPEFYMRTFVWQNDRIDEEASNLGVDFGIRITSVSPWQYIPGTNIRIFRDPAVDQLYHIGFTGHRNLGEGMQVLPEHFQLKYTPNNSKAAVDIGEVVALYEQVRQLPRFDRSQAPLMEIQIDEHGKLHFLQYLKTGNIINPAQAYEVAINEKSVPARRVKGATAPEGIELKIYTQVPKFRANMRGQAFFIDWMNHNRLAQQVMAHWGEVVINNSQLSLDGHHFDSAPFVRAKVAMSVPMKEPHFQRLVELGEEQRERAVYVNARIISNGREGAVESDWIPHYEDVA